MRFSFVVSLILHGLVLGALFIEWHSAARMHLPEKIYSIRVIGSPGARRPAGADGKRDDVKVTAPKEEPKKKAPPKAEPKAAVPKKPGKKSESKAKTKTEGKAAAPAEEPRGEASGSLAGGTTGDGTGIAVDAARFPYSYFLAAIERRVSENWYSAVSQGRAGLTCVVYFRLMRDGSVGEVRIEKSSGNDYFDRGALRAVRSGSPYPPLPGGFADDFLGIHFTFAQKE
jgi:colicin import membrane protein